MNLNKVSPMKSLNGHLPTVVSEPVPEAAGYTHTAQSFPPLTQLVPKSRTHTQSTDRQTEMSATQPTSDLEKRLCSVEQLAAKNLASIQKFDERFVEQGNALSQLMSKLDKSDQKWNKTNEQIATLLQEIKDIKISTQQVSVNHKETEERFSHLAKHIEKNNINTAAQFNAEKKRYLERVIFEENSAFRVMPNKIDGLFYGLSIFNPSSPPHITLASIVSHSPRFHQIDKSVQSQILANTAIVYVKIDAHFANPEKNTKGYTVWCASPRIATAIKSLLRADLQTQTWIITQIRSRIGHLNELRRVCHEALSPLKAISFSNNTPLKHFRLKPAISVIEGHTLMAAKIAIYLHDGASFTLSPNVTQNENPLKFSLSHVHTNPIPLLSKDSILATLSQKLKLPMPPPPLPSYPAPQMMLPSMSTLPPPPPYFPASHIPADETEPSGATDRGSAEPGTSSLASFAAAAGRPAQKAGRPKYSKVLNCEKNTSTPKSRKKKRKNISPIERSGKSKSENFSVFNKRSDSYDKKRKLAAQPLTQTH